MRRILTLNRKSVSGLGMALVLLLGAIVLPWPQQQPRAATDVQVSIQQFGRYIDEWSEPEGYFDSDNFISNETSYLHVVDDLQRRGKGGGGYLGVGAGQKFFYIVLTPPMLALISNIRRENMLGRLFFK